MPQAFYRNKLNELRRKTFREHRHFSQAKTVTALIALSLVPTPLLAAAIAGKVPLAAWLGAEAGFLLLGILLNAGGVRTIYATSYNKRLSSQQNALLRALGCGANCEFGCRPGVRNQAGTTRLLARHRDCKLFALACRWLSLMCCNGLFESCLTT
jgi:hypothetical protein